MKWGFQKQENGVLDAQKEVQIRFESKNLKAL
jgi:hypothetical protein